MPIHISSNLDPKKRYLQIALNGTLEDAKAIIFSLPISDRIIIEAGTPLIKRYGQAGIRQIYDWYSLHLAGLNPGMIERNKPAIPPLLSGIFRPANKSLFRNSPTITNPGNVKPYIVADMKTMDRGQTEVEIAAQGGASAAIALGSAPLETLNSFIEECHNRGLDAMLDMMNVEFPLSVLRSLKKPPAVVIIHRGVDEEKFNREKAIPLHEIRRIKGALNIMISIAGGDSLREVQRSIFNDADIVVVWKSVYQATTETVSLIEGFLKEVK